MLLQSDTLKKRIFPYLQENGKIILQFVFTLFFIGIGIWFLEHERTELGQIKTTLALADKFWIATAFILFVLYILLQSVMYMQSFRAVNSEVPFTNAAVLFLKRNFVSVFLPAGGVTSLAFFTKGLVQKGIKESQIYLASSIYAFIGILSVAVVAVPVFLISIIYGGIGKSEWIALISVVILLIILIAGYHSLTGKGLIYKLVNRYFPSVAYLFEEMKSNGINKRHFFYTVIASVAIELTGVFLILISARALGMYISLITAFLTYIVSVLSLIVSPFLRGLGTVEFSMSFVLMRFGFSSVAAVSITFLYRLFEFWLPLFTGALSFLLKINKLLMRILPAIILLGLGVINIISSITPAIPGRYNLLTNFIPLELIHASNYFVLMAGLLMLVTSAFLLKGLRTAWWFSICLCAVSVIGHITKAIDYEEAIIASVVLIMLIATRKEYFVKNNPELRNIGLQTSLFSMAAVMIYGTVGFFFLDKKYFNIDFSLLQSVRYTIQNYFLVGSSDLVTTHPFANGFILSIKLCGLLSLSFLIYTLVRPFYEKSYSEEHTLQSCRALLQQYGSSPLDYFKIYYDKSFFLSSAKDAFAAYRIAGNYAIVLENPVSENQESLKNCIVEFDKFCFANGLKSIYYRVPEKTLPLYLNMKKKKMLLGQEAVVDLCSFSLEGGERKSLRNSIKKTTDGGYKVNIYQPPVTDGVLQKIKSVSDEWLHTTERNEIIFSQGMFNWNELKQQTIITVESPEEKVMAFLNIIPDYAKDEATYDLIRKVHDAPNGTLDFIMIKLFEFLKSLNYQYVNLGFAPMSGIDDPKNLSEHTIKFAYEKIKSFSHYKGLRDYKEKFSPTWHNNYLIYSHDYDLIQMPVVLSKVIKP